MNEIAHTCFELHLALALRAPNLLRSLLTRTEEPYLDATKKSLIYWQYPLSQMSEMELQLFNGHMCWHKCMQEL